MAAVVINSPVLGAASDSANEQGVTKDYIGLGGLEEGKDISHDSREDPKIRKTLAIKKADHEGSEDSDWHQLNTEYRRWAISMVLPIATSLSITALVLVAVWASRGDAFSDMLGVPSWETNLFAWHPVFMVTFFVCQAFAILSISCKMYGNKQATSAHVFWQLAGVAFVVAGFVAVINSINQVPGPTHLTNLHSWLGVASLSLFTVNVIIGISKFIGHSSGDLERGSGATYLVHRVHEAFGISAVAATTLTVVTGIQLYLPVFICDYTDGLSPDPAAYYDEFLLGCKLGNGLGIVVGLTFVLLLVVAYSKNMMSI